jgi:hypothetical protein
MSRIDKFGLAKQSAMGTKQTTMEYWPPIETVDKDHQVDVIEVEENTGTRHPSAVDYGVEFWKLKLKAPALRVSSLPRLLSMYFGAPTTTTPDVTGAPTARKHAFGGTAAPVPHSLFVVNKDFSPNIIDLFWDALGDDLSLMVDTKSFLSGEFDVIAKELDDTQSDPSLTLDTSPRMSFDQIKAYVSVDGGGEVEVKVSSFDFKYGNSIDTDEAILGSRRLWTIKEGNTKAEVGFKVRDNSVFATWYRRALLTDPSQVKVRLMATGAVIGGAITYAVEVIVYATEVLEAPANVAAGDRLKEVAVKARAHYDSAASKFCEVNVTNTVTSY